jgi:hypothetical protein
MESGLLQVERKRSQTLIYREKRNIIHMAKTKHTLNEPTKCNKCGEIFPWSHEYFKFNKRTHLHCQQPCKKCYAEVSKAYRQSHPEEVKVRIKRWEESHRDNCRRKAKKWADAHKDIVKENFKKYRENNKERLYARNRVWIKEHPLSSRAGKQRYKARKREATTGSWTRADIQLQYEGQKGCCWWCGKPLKNKYHMDHRVPLAKNGIHDRTNIVISCPTCNMSKGAKLPQEFAGRLF